MTLELIDAAPATSEIPEQTESTNRKTQIRKLYFNHYPTLTSAAYESYNELLVWDSDKILAALAARLSRYRGPLTNEGFMRWATNFVRREAQRYKILAEILAEHSGIIHKSIADNLWKTSVQVRSVEHEDVFAEVTMLIFDRAHSLSKPGRVKRSGGRVKLSTRLYALAKEHCWLYHNSPNKRHRNIVQQHLEQMGELGCEVMSDEEIASLKASEVYDAGYGEIGLSTHIAKHGRL